MVYHGISQSIRVHVRPVHDELPPPLEHALLPPEAFDDHEDGWAVTAEQLATLLPRPGRRG